MVGGFKCTDCSKVFCSKATAKIHYTEIHLEADFELDCPHCNAVLKSRSGLRIHIKKCHDIVVKIQDLTPHLRPKGQPRLAETEQNSQVGLPNVLTRQNSWPPTQNALTNESVRSGAPTFVPTVAGGSRDLMRGGAPTPALDLTTGGRSVMLSTRHQGRTSGGSLVILPIRGNISGGGMAASKQGDADDPTQ